MELSVVVPCLAVVTMLAACSSHPSAMDQGVADLASADQAVVTCGTIGLDDAPQLASTFVVGDAPTLTGGPLTDGTYVLTSYTYHVADADMPPPVTMVRAQFRIGGQSWAGAIDLDGTTVTSAGFFNTVGNQLVLSNCAKKFPSSDAYAATSMSLTQETAPGTTAQAVLVFTKK